MAYRASSATTAIVDSPTSSVSVNSPVGVQVGDIVVIAILSNGSTTRTYTWPSGFTEQARLGAPGAIAHDDTIAIATKVATGSEPASYSITQSTAAAALLVCGAWAGRETTAPVTFATTTVAAGGATSVTITLNGGTAAAGDDLIWFGGLSQSNTAWTMTPPSGYATDGNVSHANNSNQILVASKDGVSAGATGSIAGSATGTVGADSFGIVISLAQAATAVYDPITSCFPIGYYE